VSYHIRAHDQVRQLLLRLAFRLFQRLRVAVHRCPEGGVSREFLHNLRVHAQRLDQRRERVPADFLVDAGTSLGDVFCARALLQILSGNPLHDSPSSLVLCHLVFLVSSLSNCELMFGENT